MRLHYFIRCAPRLCADIGLPFLHMKCCRKVLLKWIGKLTNGALQFFFTLKQQIMFDHEGYYVFKMLVHFYLGSQYI